LDRKYEYGVRRQQEALSSELGNHPNVFINEHDLRGNNNNNNNNNKPFLKLIKK
jgi:hypothetical protein